MRYCSSLLFLLTLKPRLVLLAEHCQLDVNLREYSENVSLKDRDEDLEREEYNRGGDGDHGHERPEVQDEAEEDEDDQVPRQYVGVEPHPQRERLGELLHELDESHERDHDRLGRQARRHEALQIPEQPVAPHALELRQDKGQQRKRQREGYAARHGVAAREQPHDVEHQYKDEERERSSTMTWYVPVRSLRYLAPTNVIRNVIGAPMSRNHTRLLMEISMGPRCMGTTHEWAALSQVWRICFRISSWVNCCISARFPINSLPSVLLPREPIPEP